MSDTERLAALLHELGVGCMSPIAVCDPTDPRYADFHPATAARLVAAGVRVEDEDDAAGAWWDREVAHHKAVAAIEAEASRIDPDRLARAVVSATDSGYIRLLRMGAAAAIAKAYEEEGQA